ncbi:MAG: DUF5689 domain-containing protein [Bacteroidota bacterium]
MKKYILLFAVMVMFFGCEEELIDQPAISFYPNTAVEATEGDGVTYTVRLETTGILTTSASIQIDVTNGAFLVTTPALESNTLTLNLEPGQTSTFFTVQVLEDVIPSNYEAIFKVSSVTGGLSGIANGTFTLFVNSLDLACPEAESIERTDLSVARSQIGETLTIVGSVNSTDYGFNSGQYFVEDETGGINIFHSANQGLVNPGDVVKIVGEVSTFSEQVQIAPNSVDIICEENGIPVGVEISGSDLTLTSEFLGRRVRLSGVTINEADWPTVPIGTGSGVNVSASVDGVSFIIRIDRGESFYDGSDSPGGTIDLIGTMGRFADDVQIFPFFDGDVTSAGSGGGGSSGGGSGNATALPFTDDFENCAGAGEFNIPENWVEYNAPGTNTDRGWACRPFARSGSWAVQASANSGDAAADDAWLISATAFDLTSVSNAYLQFYVESFFDGDGGITLLYSSDYDGSGDPTTGSWTEVTDINSQLPAAGSGGFVEILTNLTGATGNEIYLAFQFESTTSNSSSWTIDDLVFSETEPGSGGGGGGSEPDLSTISTVRSMAGMEVKIQGIVTTPDYGFNNGQFYVQDGTAGINVFWGGNFGQVAIGDEVEIIGTIGDFSSQVQISPSSLSVIGTGNALPAGTVITDSELTVDSDLQGSRVTISGVTLVDDSQWPTAPIDAGSGVSVEATVGGVTFEIRIDRGESFYDGSSVPSQPFTITGALGRFEDTPQILPFVNGDIN